MDRKETIILSKEKGVATITLNRPEVRNAMNLQMIRDIRAALEELNRDEAIRLILFNSSGTDFCSGADLHWMRAGSEQPEDQLKSESLELAALYRTIRETSRVTICSVRGRVPGGAVGLLAASDFVVAEPSVVLVFPETKLGLVPATIAPYVLRKAGFSLTSDWMMTGRPVGASEAHQAGLIHRICGEGSLEASTGQLVSELLSGGVRAVQGVKSLLRRLEDLTDPDEVDRYTSGLIAGFRISPEGQEGMRAFFEKRKPGWDEGQ